MTGETISPIREMGDVAAAMEALFMASPYVGGVSGFALPNSAEADQNRRSEIYAGLQFRRSQATGRLRSYRRSPSCATVF